MPVRTQGDRAPLSGGVPPPPVGVGVVARDGEVRHAQAEEPDVGPAGHRDLARAGADPVGRDDEVELLLGAVLDADPHPPPVVVEGDDLVAEAVGHPVRGVLEQDLPEVAAQDLQLGGGAVARGAVTGRHGELRLHRTGAVDEGQTPFPGAGRAHRLLDAGTRGHDPAGTAHVHVLATEAQLGSPLQHGGLHPVAVQPVGERRTGDARSGDEHSAGGHASLQGDRGASVPLTLPAPPAGRRGVGVGWSGPEVSAASLGR